jgi:putative transposase
VSIRSACGNLLLDASTFHNRSQLLDRAALKERIKDICESRVRCRYWRVHVALRWEGWFVNQKKVRRLYNEMGLQLRNKHSKRKLRAKLIRDRRETVSPLEVWAVDFVHDQLATRRKFRIPTVVDTRSRYAPTIDARYSYRGKDMIVTLKRICAQTGYPIMIRVDHGSEFISRDLSDLWAYVNGVTLDFSWPGKPTDNAFIEAFNGRQRAEWLSANWFMGLPNARETLKCWRKDYNTVRPHSAIRNKTPITLSITPVYPDRQRENAAKL